ncbi:MAG: hypothetical protein M0Z99_03170 [Betaproteobacteria bacterium]|nr:hypothetical protein [Betaproteobacteria bacterium]
MKKILVMGLITGLCSTGAFAAACTFAGTGVQAGAIGTPVANTEQCACDGGKAQKTSINGGPGAVVATPVFTKTGFEVQCSSNTVVSYNEVSGTLFAVAAGSGKGNQLFSGNSNGGAVATSTTACTGTNKACLGTDVSGELARAVAAGSS